VEQLELSLDMRSKILGSLEPWSYRFEKGSLIEELGDDRFVYGMWDNLFGCWKIGPAGSSSNEIIPDWLPLNPAGAWRHQRWPASREAD
jgi:hypothetical protein